MASYQDRERFIPFQKREIVEMLADDGGLPGDQAGEFRQFCRLLESLFHFEFHQKLEHLKESYFPLNPDVITSRTFTLEEMTSAQHQLVETFREVLDEANFEEISHGEIEAALEEGGVLKLKLVVDTEDFETIQFYRRGRREETVEIPHFKFFKKQKVIEVYDRVVLLVRYKPASYFEGKKRRHLQFAPGSTMIKISKDIPREDLEMLFPNIQVVMDLRDKLLMGVPMIAGGIPVLIKIVPALIVLFTIIAAYFGVAGILGIQTDGQDNQDVWKFLVAGGGAIGALIGYLFQQWMKYKNKRYKFQQELSDSLFYRNLDNNVGVFHYLIDTAEEEECKEAFLAYYFLLVTQDPLTGDALDDRIETWFEKSHKCSLDFEIDDALAKLKRLNLLEEDKTGGALRVPPLPEALRRMDEIWDNYFQYN